MSRWVVLLGVGAWCLGGCFGGGGVFESGCVEGRSIACSCESGAPGVTTCQSDGMYSECDCTGGAAGNTPGTGGGSTASGASGSGSGGSGIEPAAGSSGTGGAASQADAGGTGRSGTNGSGVDAGVGTGGSGAVDAGMKGSGHPPGLYTACNNSTQCMGELECLVAQRGLPGDYCTMRCRDAQGTVTADCAAPATGTVPVGCDALSGLCQLGSCQAAACPDGMTCTSAWGGFAGMFCGF